MFTWNFCNSAITEAFVCSEKESKIFSCFDSFIQTLKPFRFDYEFAYYPLFGMRDIQLEDSVVFLR